MPDYDREREIRKRYWDLTDEEVELLEARMRPGAYSRTGFLGPGESLRAVIEEDWRQLDGVHPAFLGEDLVCYLAIARGYEQLWERDHPSWQPGTWFPIRHGMEARITRSPGIQACPFGRELEGKREQRCWATDLDFVIRRISDGETLEMSGLLPHLAFIHCFFEGRDVPHRLDPVRAARFCGTSK